jgi:CheY-like chemotaxis protein
VGLIDDLGSGFIGLDTPLFIYFIKEDPKYLSVVRPVFAAIANGNLTGITSALTLLETLYLMLNGGYEDDEATKKKIRVILVDDHIIVRQGLARLLRIEEGMELVGEASDGAAAVNLVREVRPDVVLRDLSISGMNGIEATRMVHRGFPEVRMIGLSMFQEGEQPAALRDAGAVAYVTKSGS